ncbi:TIGR02680 family protein [Bacillus litorisediminis]|uniref:TIGR02680 family protein n=1 Tax=Bacillus litorisediminis TaxID=2922713 RepID=UPI001FAE0D6F|nr:TIGR02680 family protein [Bacillus litorisediminis]
MENVFAQPNKWVMNLAGVLNYWYYKWEVFPFENGHLIIKGANGTGKSVTTQSFLPLLLDGNKQPSRLDPFGSRSRKMIDYIFGENPDVPEKTSYLFLEYKKNYTDEYITTGIGFKANFDTDRVDSWHFLIKNKRVGKDFDLFRYQLDEKGEKVMVPLSQKELENYIDREKCGYVKEKPRDYAELVNNYIFKFESLEDYLDMVNLVVRIRTPKLSNDLGPSVIYQILERSLPEITFNDLRSLTETIQNIDLHNQRLTKTKEDNKLLKKLTSKYQEYNRTVLSFKATDYNKTVAKRKAAETDYKKAQKELADSTKKLNTLLEEIQSLELEQKQLDEKLRAFEDNDVRKAQRRLTELEPQLEKKKHDFESQKNRLENKINAQRSLFNEKKEKEDELYEYEKKNQLYLDELDEKVNYIDFDSHILNRDNFVSKFVTQDPTIVADQWRATLDGHMKEIHDIAKLLYRENELKIKLDERNQEIFELDEELQDIEKDLSQLRLEFEEKIELFNRDILDWNDSNTEFNLQKEELNQFVMVLSTLFEGTTLFDIEELVRKFYSNLREVLIQNRAQAEAALAVLKVKIIKKEEELQKVRKKKEHEPEQSEQTTKVREKLLKEGIPFVPFYEAVEFKEFVTIDEQERLESSLIQMGILDGLIVGKKYINAITESDAVLLPQPLKEEVKTLHEYLEVHLPEKYNTLASEVEGILKSISIEEIVEGSYVTSFGSYQHGVVKGYAPFRESVSFIGKEARKQYRQKLIAELEGELAALNKEQDELHLVLEMNTSSTQLLANEKEQFPSSRELKEQNDKMEVLERRINVINEQKERIEKGIRNIRTDYNNTRRERIKKAENRTLKPTIEAYESAREECAEYARLLDDLRFNGKSYFTIKHTIRSLQSQIEDAEADIDDMRYTCNQTEQEKKRMENAIKELEEFLEKETTSDIKKEIREAEERKAQIPVLLQEKAEKKGELNNLIPQLTKNIGIKDSSIAFYSKLQKVKGTIFVNEINKKFIETFDHDTLSNEEDLDALLQTVVEELGEKTYQDVQSKQDELKSELRDISLKGLEDYHPTATKDFFGLPEISVEGFEIFAKEIEELELTNQRTIISLMYEGKTSSPMSVQKELDAQIEVMQAALKAEDEKMYKEIIMDKIGERIRELIVKANKWKAEINKLMSERQTSSGLQLSIEWKPKEAKELDELKTSELISLLQRDPDTLKDSDYNKLTKHFTSKIQYAKDIYEEDEENKEKSLDYVIKDVLDYRKWFEFKIYFKKGDDNKKELTKNRFNALSGGERAMSMYIPLLSALFSKYSSASEDAPYIVSMDEAFAGVDDNNIRDMFELLGNLDLNYILNSQSLWGDFDTVDSLSIAEIIRPKNSKDVTVIHFKWNGKELLAVKNESPQKEQEDLIELTPEQLRMFDLIEKI